MSNPYQVVRDFEAALCEYTGAPYAVTVNSCTMALLLACKYHARERNERHNVNGAEMDVVVHPYRPAIMIPSKTYVSVPMSIKHAGYCVKFKDYDWLGYYQLKPLPVFDCARWFSSGMYNEDPPFREDKSYKGNMLCVSFHASKILGDTQGGAILHDDPKADAWFRRMRFDGRTEGVVPKDDHFDMLGYHCYMSPDVAARLLLKLSVLPKHNNPLPNDDYPSLDQFEVFK